VLPYSEIKAYTCWSFRLRVEKGPTSVFGILKYCILKILRICLFLNQWSGDKLQQTQLLMIYNL